MHAALAFYRAARDADVDAIASLDEFDEFWPADIPRDASRGVEARAWGMNAAAEIAQGRVAAWCAPAIYRRGGRLDRGWGFTNLAGAMWLQLFWRITAGDEDPLCENRDCPRDNPVLTRASGTTGPRKRFCSDTCRARAHYIKRTVGR
jgi:hypothetical protein